MIKERKEKAILWFLLEKSLDICFTFAFIFENFNQKIAIFIKLIKI